MATSGDYRHWVEVQGRRLSHTMDPARGALVLASLASVTVVAQSCAEADVWATALMVLGADRGASLARKRGLDALFLLRDYDGSTRGVGVGRLFSEEPAAMAPAEGEARSTSFSEAGVTDVQGRAGCGVRYGQESLP